MPRSRNQKPAAAIFGVRRIELYHPAESRRIERLRHLARRCIVFSAPDY